MVNDLLWSYILTFAITICWIDGISSAPMSASDHLRKLQPVERQFYRTYCGVWGYMPHSVVKVTKPAHLLVNRIVSSGATKHCLELILKVEYPMPIYEEIKTLQESKLPIIWVLGGPASGKGSVCAKFAKANSFTHISTGDLLRAEVETPPNPGIGKLLQETMNQGQLVPSFLPLNLMVKKMKSLVGKTNGFLIDGYPRALDQAILFQNTVRSPDAIVFLEASNEVMKRRALKRNEGRADDNEETFNKRLQVFHSQSTSVITSDVFKSKVKKINSEGTMDDTVRLFSAAINDVYKSTN